MKTINCKGTLIELSNPKIMGVLNITPDSFYSGSRYNTKKTIVTQAEKMLTQGATFIDVGAYSSRPKATHISEEEELQRILPVVQLLIKTFPEILISVDTFRSSIAQKTIDNGAAIINDISGGTMDANMFDTVATLQVPYIMMHIQGTPQNMQNAPTYKNATMEIMAFFAEKLFQLRQLKVNDVIIDPGFGFGKTIEHNYELLKNLSFFKNLEVPILAGISRKSMLYKPLKITPKKVLNATTCANTIALLNGANILRVHDVKPAMEVLKITGYVL